jgi:hypothetical protein
VINSILTNGGGDWGKSWLCDRSYNEEALLNQPLHWGVDSLQQPPKKNQNFGLDMSCARLAGPVLNGPFGKHRQTIEIK